MLEASQSEWHLRGILEAFFPQKTNNNAGPCRTHCVSNMAIFDVYK